MPGDAFITIGMASRISGVTVETIRAWERRYGFPRPNRARGGRRLFRPDDVERLRLLRRAIESGHSIGAIHFLPFDELRALAAERLEKPTRGFQKILTAASSLDAGPLDDAAAGLGPRDLALDLLAPLLDLAERELAPAPLQWLRAEVAAIAAARRRQVEGARGPAVVLAGGEEARLGLASLLVAAGGLRALHLGAAADPATAADVSTAAQAAALVTCGDARAFARRLPPQVALWALFGPAPPDAVPLDSYESLVAELPALLR
jgi:DNA-binding transcriptional MerR regulator